MFFSFLLPEMVSQGWWKQRWSGRDDLENTDEERGEKKRSLKEKNREMETDGQRADGAT